MISRWRYKSSAVLTAQREHDGIFVCYTRARTHTVTHTLVNEHNGAFVRDTHARTHARARARAHTHTQARSGEFERNCVGVNCVSFEQNFLLLPPSLCRIRGSY